MHTSRWPSSSVIRIFWCVEPIKTTYARLPVVQTHACTLNVCYIRVSTMQELLSTPLIRPQKNTNKKSDDALQSSYIRHLSHIHILFKCSTFQWHTRTHARAPTHPSSFVIYLGALHLLRSLPLHMQASSYQKE